MALFGSTPQQQAASASGLDGPPPVQQPTPAVKRAVPAPPVPASPASRKGRVPPPHKTSHKKHTRTHAGRKGIPPGRTPSVTKGRR